jgi:hypothetical protein
MSAKETDSEILLQNLNDDSSSDDKRPVDDKARDTGRRTRLFLDMDAKQWLVIASAWIAWMIDVFDGTICTENDVKHASLTNLVLQLTTSLPVRCLICSVSPIVRRQ